MLLAQAAVPTTVVDQIAEPEAYDLRILSNSMTSHRQTFMDTDSTLSNAEND